MNRTMWAAFIGCVISFSMLAGAQSTDCNNPHALVPDGQSTDILLSGSTTYWFVFGGIAGHSYAYEQFATFANTALQSNDATPFAPSDDPCGVGTTSLTFFAPSSADPALDTSGGLTGRRRTFIAPAGGNYKIRVAQGASGQTSRFRVVDTTLYNPRWSTFSGFITQWEFFNTSNSLLSVTVTATPQLPSAGAPSSITFSVAPGTSVLRVIGGATGDIVIGANKAGFATAVHNGAPGALKADAYFINAAATVIVPSSFEERNSAH